MNACSQKPRFRFPSILAGLLSLSLLAAQSDTSGPAAVPTPAEQQAMLNAMRQYASDYIARLPNFICTQDTQQFQAGRRPTHWHKGDTLRFKLVFFGGSEARSIELVNNRAPGPGQRWRAPLTTEGEFGTLLGSVFGASSDTVFHWRGWDTLNGRHVAVFDFAVDRAHSTMQLTFSDLAHSIVAYHGSVYADPTTGAVWRVTNNLSDIPPEIRTKTMSTLIQYAPVLIAGTEYLLPVEATVQVDTGTNNIRNEIAFSGYRKFETDSHITYTSDEPAKPTPPQ